MGYVNCYDCITCVMEIDSDYVCESCGKYICNGCQEDHECNNPKYGFNYNSKTDSHKLFLKFFKEITILINKEKDDLQILLNKVQQDNYNLQKKTDEQQLILNKIKDISK